MRLSVLVSLVALALAGCATVSTLDTRFIGSNSGDLSGSTDYPRCAGSAQAGGCPPWQDWPR